MISRSTDFKFGALTTRHAAPKSMLVRLSGQIHVLLLEVQNQHQLAVRAGFDLTIYGFQIRRSNHTPRYLQKYASTFVWSNMCTSARSTGFRCSHSFQYKEV